MRYLQFIFIVSQVLFSSAVLSETWLNLSKVTNTTLNNLVLKLVDAQLASCQRCQANAQAGFVVGLLNDQKAAILGMPDYNERFSVSCSVSFLQSIEGVNCSFNFTDRGDHKLELGSNVGNVPYAGYVNTHAFNEFFAKTFVNWRSKPFYAIITGLFKAMPVLTTATPTTATSTPIPSTLAPTTAVPITVAPTTAVPITVAPTTAVQITVAPTTAVPRHRTRTDTPSVSSSFSQTTSSSSSETVTGSQSISGSTSQSLSSTGSISISQPESVWALWSRATGVYADGASQVSRYTISSGVVTDSYTSLQWQAANSPTVYTWSASAASGSAQAYCASRTTGGFNDWRLPTRAMLQTLVDYTKVSPAIDGTVFPNTESNYYWTSTPYALNSGRAWYVFFAGGIASTTGISVVCYARCVRSSSITMPLVRYIDETGAALTSGSAQIKDIVTGLIWQRAYTTSKTWSATSAAGSAQLYCSQLAIGAQGAGSWRLPTVKELTTLLDLTASSAVAIDSVAFPTEASSSFWSSTVYQPNSAYVWYVDFYDGYTTTAGLSASLYARCVR